MFTFSQSVDIANFETKDHQQQSGSSHESFSLLTNLRLFLLSDILPWLEQLTGATLDKDKVDFTSSIYQKNDFLLCHDDELDRRRVAFIWYLVPEMWDVRNDGGSLDLFRSSGVPEERSNCVPPVKTGPSQPVYPWRIAASVAPKRNMFCFFEPSAFSFHQVSEVVGSRDRLSLHGWFHGPPHPRPADVIRHPTPIPLVSPVHIEEELVYRWVNPVYLDMGQQAKVRRRFVKRSEIQLTNILKEEQWIAVCRVLASLDSSAWDHCGPYSRKNYYSLSGFGTKCFAADSIPDTLRELYRLMRSEAMLVILSDLTGITLHPDALQSDDKDFDQPPIKRRTTNGESSLSDVPTEVSHTPISTTLTDPHLRRWTAGSYTLLSDSDLVDVGWRLESTLHLGGYGHRASNQQSWQTSWGGQLVYTEKDAKHELLTVLPVDNALTLVYTGPGTASFMKYINHSSKPCPLPLTEPCAVTPLVAYDIWTVFHDPNTGAESEDQQQDNSDSPTTYDSSSTESDNEPTVTTSSSTASE